MKENHCKKHKKHKKKEKLQTPVCLNKKSVPGLYRKAAEKGSKGEF